MLEIKNDKLDQSDKQIYGLLAESTEPKLRYIDISTLAQTQNFA